MLCLRNCFWLWPILLAKIVKIQFGQNFGYHRPVDSLALQTLPLIYMLTGTLKTIDRGTTEIILFDALAAPLDDKRIRWSESWKFQLQNSSTLENTEEIEEETHVTAQETSKENIGVFTQESSQENEGAYPQESSQESSQETEHSLAQSLHLHSSKKTNKKEAKAFQRCFDKLFHLQN